MLQYASLSDGDASGVAHDAVTWGERSEAAVLRDGLFVGEYAGDRYAPHNRIGDAESFKIGFDLALNLGARIAANPLGEINVVDLVDGGGGSISSAAKTCAPSICGKRE